MSAPATADGYLDALESESVHIIRESYATLGRLALLWSPGKDSNAMVWLCRKAFFGHVPFPVVHLDTGRTFKEVYAFRDRHAAAWNLDLIVSPCPPVSTVDPSLPARAAARKTAGVEAAIAEHGFTGILAGIRRDEEGTRAKERVFGPRGSTGAWDVRGQPPEFWDQYNSAVPAGGHVRVHPLLHWSESDIWRYTAREGIPVIPLYFAQPASATAPSATRTSPPRWRAMPPPSRRSSPSSRRPESPSAPAAPWTARRRTRSSACSMRWTPSMYPIRRARRPRGAALPHGGPGRLPLRRAAHRRRARGQRPGERRRPGALLALEQDRAGREHRGVERAGAGCRSGLPAARSGSPSTSRSRSSAARR